MVKVIRSLVILLISYLLLFLGSVSAEIDTTMIGVRKYQKFDYLQTKYEGNFHPFFPIDVETYILAGIVSHEDHIFSIKIKNIDITDTNNPRLNCQYIRDDLESYSNHCSLDEPIIFFSPVVYTDWEYWEVYLQERVSNSNSTITGFEIINDDNVFGYTWEYNWVDSVNNSIFGHQSVTKVYDKKMGNIIRFYNNHTSSLQEFDGIYEYEFVSVSMNYDLDFFRGDMIGFIIFLIILVILIYLLYRKVKKELSSHKLLDTS